MSTDSHVHIAVRLTPRSGQPGIVGWQSASRQLLVVRVSEPPVEGRANSALVGVLAESLHIAKSRIQIVRGAKTRQKMIELGMDIDAFVKWAQTIPVIGRSKS